MADKVDHSFWIQSISFHSFRDSFLPWRQSVGLKTIITFESVFCQQFCIVIKQKWNWKINNSGTVCLPITALVDSELTETSTMCFCSKWPEWNFLITQRSQASFFSFFSCFLERACTSFLVYELILIFSLFSLKKWCIYPKVLYRTERNAASPFWYDGP